MLDGLTEPNDGRVFVLGEQLGRGRQAALRRVQARIGVQLQESELPDRLTVRERVASRARSIEAASGWPNVVILPMWLLSGVFFSYERFPEWLWPTLRWLPLTALNAGLRAIIDEGQSIFALGHEALVLVVWTVLTFAIALRTFRWQ